MSSTVVDVPIVIVLSMVNRRRNYSIQVHGSPKQSPRICPLQQPYNPVRGTQTNITIYVFGKRRVTVSLYSLVFFLMLEKTYCSGGTSVSCDGDLPKSRHRTSAVQKLSTPPSPRCLLQGRCDNLKGRARLPFPPLPSKL